MLLSWAWGSQARPAGPSWPVRSARGASSAKHAASATKPAAVVALYRRDEGGARSTIQPIGTEQRV
eukprot:scaffold35866_cov124-Isochrysis_galbana.AAC.4